jgi:plasmid stabilization system protein ParE
VARLIWSPAASRDIGRLHRFLAGLDRAAAARAVRVIRESLRILEALPGAGRPVDDPSGAMGATGAEFREWIIGFGDTGYVALYRYDGDTVIILAVRHQREAGVG